MQTKRHFAIASIAILLMAFISAGLASAFAVNEPNGARVTADFAPLRTTIALSIGDNIFKSSEMGGTRHPFFSSGLPRGALREHAAMMGILRKNGVRVLDVRDLLDSAIQSARRAGKLSDWLRETFPATADEIIKRINELDADSLLGRRDDHFYVTGPDGLLNPLFPGITSMYWARDFAISTPKGIVIGNGRFYNRAIENSLARFMFEYADELKPFPIVFDASKEGVLLDGGDVIVLDEKTLLVGVGNRSSLGAAPKLARQLGMDVLAVSLPPADKPSGLSRQLLHLDSIFNLVDSKKILAVPFFLEKNSSDTNPLKPVLLGIARQVDEMKRFEGERDLGNSDEIRRTVELMPEVGWVTRFEASTGTATPLRLKLLDYFRERGYQIIYVGGEQGKLPLGKYAIERAMYELRWQGANVVQLGPGRVIAYEHNIYTNEALKRAGVEVLTFPGELLSIRNGGPHCLLMPLVRNER
ncbi:MAG: arginine deiminase family protein [Blastocatellia bacterium]|nr:arginine deiminase family protein [Blastocatellia bacterium]